MAEASGSISTIWGWRDEGPELLAAWDAYAVEGNEEGWREAQETALAEVNTAGSGFWREAGIRVVVMTFDFDQIESLFLETEVEASVVSENGDG